MTPSRAQKSLSKASPYFLCKDRAGFDGDRFNAVRLFPVVSEDSAERDSLDESSAFLIEGAHFACRNLFVFLPQHQLTAIFFKFLTFRQGLLNLFQGMCLLVQSENQRERNGRAEIARNVCVC